MTVFWDALQEFVVLPSSGHLQTCSTKNKMQLCNCYLRNRQWDLRGAQIHMRSPQFCFENIYSEKKKQLGTYWFRFKSSKRTQLHKAELSCASPKGSWVLHWQLSGPQHTTGYRLSRTGIAPQRVTAHHKLRCKPLFEIHVFPWWNKRKH